MTARNSARASAQVTTNAFLAVRRLTLNAEQVDNFEEQQVELFRPSLSNSCSSHAGSSPATTGANVSGSEQSVAHAAEPRINTKADITTWIEWAKQEARLHADLH